MATVLVLIAASGSDAINDEVLTLMGTAPHWLSKGEAAEFAPPPDLAELRQKLSHFPIDVNVVPKANRRKRLLIADMDSTMIQQECIDELGVVAGLGEKIKAITVRAMRGEIDFADAVKERVGLMAGLDAKIIDVIIRDRITLMPGGRTLVTTMKSHGAYTALVSGGFRQFTSKVAAQIGFHANEANDFIIADGKLAGKVAEPILGKDAKLAALKHLALVNGLTAADAIAVGDGANDIPMLQAAGMGVALHAKPKVQEAVSLCINHGDLTALLYLQGYTKAQFI
ncbi:MAG TPA: phosphoserine phosphatase SerB [Aestuariivirga sp.]|nr:phosphoserine phosphatase SerB [Aestuariivirga sp.]